MSVMTDHDHDNAERMDFLLTLRRRGIGDSAVLRAMDEVPRENFVGRGMTEAAYFDQALPIACGQTISQPYVVAYMTEQLGVRSNHRVLEIGTGSGYQAAILAQLAREVVTIERYRTLADLARAAPGRARLSAMSKCWSATAWRGRPNSAPFDRIIVTAAAEEMPEHLVGQLADQGHHGAAAWAACGPQDLVKLTKTKDGLARENLIAVRFVPLLAGQAKEL